MCICSSVNNFLKHLAHISICIHNIGSFVRMLFVIILKPVCLCSWGCRYNRFSCDTVYITGNICTVFFKYNCCLSLCIWNIREKIFLLTLFILTTLTGNHINLARLESCKDSIPACCFIFKFNIWIQIINFLHNCNIISVRFAFFIYKVERRICSFCSNCISGNSGIVRFFFIICWFSTTNHHTCYHSCYQ